MAKYATNTSVAIAKSQQEIQTILRKYGARKFGTMENPTKIYLMFEYENFAIQIEWPLPDRNQFEVTPSGRRRKRNQIEEAYDQAVKQRWRSLVLNVKAKLEAIEDGCSVLEKEFMGDIVMPDGRPLSSHLLPQLNQIAQSGKLPKLLQYQINNKE